jgi:cell wall assembly regulator SMI1
MEQLLARLDQWLARYRARFHKNLQPSATKAQLDGLGKQLGKPVPAALAALLHWHNGQGEDYAGYFQDHWNLMSAERIAETKAELDAADSEYGWNKNWLPFLDDDGGNFVCLDLSKAEPPVVGFWMGAKPEALAPSLETWLGDFVKGLEAGEFHEDPERGTLRKVAKKKK